MPSEESRSVSRASSHSADAPDRITAVGLIFEASEALHRILSPPLEQLLGVTGKSFDICFRLRRTPGGALRMSDLAAQTALTPSGLTRAVDRLEAAALVRRESCSSDRRGAFAQLTEYGFAQTDAAMALHRRHLDELFETMFEPGDEAELVRLMHVFRDRVYPGATQLTSEDETADMNKAISAR